MRVRDIMTRSVVTTTPAISVKDAAVVLTGHGVTLLPVLDEQTGWSGCSPRLT